MPDAMHLEMEVAVLAGDAASTLATSDPMLAIGTPNDKQLAEINRRMPLTAKLTAEELFVWTIQAGNNLTHAYFMWLDESSLKNMMMGANMGRGYPYLMHHDTRSDPHGRVFYGATVNDGSRPAPPLPEGAIPLARDVKAPGGDLVRLLEAIYMPRDIVVNGANNNDLIRNLETGVQASNSLGIGFYSPVDPVMSAVLCDIDGADMFRSDWELCPHFPGVDYEIRLGEGDNAKQMVVTSTGRVVNAGQDEVSGVYLGAVPDTFTERALGLYRAGKLGEKEARGIEQRFTLSRGTIVGGKQAIVDMGRNNSPARQAPTPKDGEMDDLLSKVMAALKGDAGRLAALELHGADVDPLAALVKVLTDEADEHRERADASEGKHTAYKQREAEWLKLIDGETVDAARARKDVLATLGAEAQDRLVEEYTRQRTRLGLTTGDEMKAQARGMKPADLIAETKAQKVAADKLFPAGAIIEADVPSRNGATNNSAPVRRRATTRV